jgi:hypothetical protein
VEDTPDRLHPLLTVTALAVTAVALATVGVIIGVIPDRTAPAAPAGAAAATFATRLAEDPWGLGPALYAPQPMVRACEDCATVQTVRPIAQPGPSVQGASQWEVRVRMEDGTMLTLATEGQPSWHAGQRVRFVDGVLMSM